MATAPSNRMRSLGGQSVTLDPAGYSLNDERQRDEWSGPGDLLGERTGTG